ncbi:MAG: protein kinase [Acidobacteriota bacterium]
MTPERWARIKEVFGAALEKPEALDELCGGDAELRHEVERLLAEKDGTLQSPVAPRELAPGEMLGHYRVEAKLGQGGMGTVYRAYDTPLQRPVALKVLHECEERLLREARAASALNHPNIVTIYEVGPDFIAIELVEGKPLEGRLPLKRALDYAAQIAGALAKAHAAGVIHRDLKPGNVMMTPDGLVKLLDFGLAKRTRLPEGHSLSLTAEGEIAGTPSYMSPEQAEGKKADERSDIFSFGVVLYEMLSGRRAFTGDSTVSILGAVLKDEPPPLTGVPADLNKLIERCLRKDPARRIQHMDDVKLVLEELREAPHRRPSLVRVAALFVLAAVVVVALWFLARRARTPAAEMRIVPLTSYPGRETQPSFSPDGNQVAFAWNGEKEDNYDIYVRVVGSAAAPLRLTTDPAFDYSPAWSPDGRQIAFVRQQGGRAQIRLISPLGGPERRLAELEVAAMAFPKPLLMAWSPDGKWLATSERAPGRPWGIILIAVETGEQRRLTTNSAGADHSPAFSPNGRYLAYASCPGPVSPSCDLYLLALAPDLSPKGRPRRLTSQRTDVLGVAWAPDGQSLVYAASRCSNGPFPLWRVAVSGATGPERIELPGPEVRYPAVSRTARRLAFVQVAGDLDIWRYQLGSVPARFISSTLNDSNPQFSPDGTRIAFVSNRDGGCQEIWVSAPDGLNALQLTNEVGRVQGTPHWSPDGRWIAFDSLGDDGHADVYVMEAGGGAPRRLTPYPSDESVPSWSRDGKWIYFRSDRTGRNEIWKMPFDGGETRQVTENGGYVAFESWDGKTLYYLKAALTGALFSRSLVSGPERQVLGTVVNRAFLPVEDGIYYVAPGDRPGTSALQFYEFATGKSRLLAAIPRASSQGLTVSPDHRTVLFVVQNPGNADLMLIENFR